MPKKNQKRKKVRDDSNVPPTKDAEMPKTDETLARKRRRQGPKLAKKTNPYQSHEYIIKSIIDKIITLSVRNSYVNYINNIMNDYYFQYIKNQLKSIFEENFMYHTTIPNNTKNNNKNLNKELFWNKPNTERNTWIEIKEPNTIKCDRYENTFMNLKEYSNPLLLSNISAIISDENIFDDLNGRSNKKSKSTKSMSNPIIQHMPRFSVDSRIINKVNITKKLFKINNSNNFLVQEENSSQSSKEENINNKKVPNKSPSNIKKKENKTTQKKKVNIVSNINQKKANTLDIFDRIKKREKSSIPLDLPFFEIPNIENEYNFDKFDPPGVSNLRQEKVEENLKKEKEITKNIITKQVESKVQAAKVVKEKIIKKMKPFDPNKFSFDSNGKIISFKKINVDNFNKEFIDMKNIIIDLNKQKQSNQNLNKIKKLKKSKNKELKISKKEEENLEIPTVDIIHNPEDDPNGINKHNYVKLSDEKLNEKIIPGGSNFSIISPNIGVIIKENDQTKEGNRDFGKYFKKYSLNEYSKMLNDYVPLQNKTMLLNKVGLPKLVKSSSQKLINNVKKTQINNIIKNKSSKNINNNNLTNIDISNPLIKEESETAGDDTTFNNYNKNNYSTINNNHSTNKLFNSNSSYNNLYNSSSYNINLNRSNSIGMDNTIKLNKVGLSSLKMEIDSMKDLSQNIKYNNYYTPGKTMIKSLNLFNKHHRNDFKDINIVKIRKNKFNEFNTGILSSDGWGSVKEENGRGENTKLLYSKHRTRYQALRELGSNILTGIKVKLPRDRKVDINI